MSERQNFKAAETSYSISPEQLNPQAFKRGSIYTTIMELRPKNHNGDGFLVPNSIIAVYRKPKTLSRKLEHLKP